MPVQTYTCSTCSVLRNKEIIVKGSRKGERDRLTMQLQPVAHVHVTQQHDGKLAVEYLQEHGQTLRQDHSKTDENIEWLGWYSRQRGYRGGGQTRTR